MKIGDIFRKKFSFNSKKITVFDIDKSVNNSFKYNSYADTIVSKRGNIFKNKDINIDKMVDESLKHPLCFK